MAEETTEKAELTSSLEPTKERIMGKVSYFFAWMGGCVSIGTFTMGSSLVGTLNLIQIVLAIAIGCFVIGIGLAINGAAGYKYGIPFVIQIRSSFGTMGSKIPGLVRAVPALVWFGFQSWIGAAAINQVVVQMFGLKQGNMWIAFTCFMILQIGLSMFGFHGIKWLENIGSAFILFALVYMFINVITKYGSEINLHMLQVEGTWGLPFWNATMLFLGIYATMMLNVSDYSREHTEGTGRSLLTTIYAMSILPVTLFMGLIGAMVSGATGVVDPIQVFSNAVDNKILLVITLLFIAFAQVTTNVLNNVVPPVYVLMDVFHLKYRLSVALVGVLSVATFPWKLVTDESADGLQIFVQIYSAFLGPVFAVMVVDYYFIRQRKLDTAALYDKEGVFKGINWAGVSGTVLGVAVAFLIPAIGWYASLIPAGLTYYLLMTKTPLGKKFLPKSNQD